MRYDLFKCAVVLFATVGATQTAYAQRVQVVRDPDSANILTIKKARNMPEGDLSGRIEKDGYGKPRVAISPDKTNRAYVFCVASGSREVPACTSRVFVTNLKTGVTYEISGETLFIEANRPVDNLAWINKSTLSYERWTSPHFGHRYVVDIKQMKQTGAFILSDQ